MTAATLPSLKLQWRKYADFFRLYDKKSRVPQLIYVIGDCRCCYIGSVGGNGGQNGLARRYEKQYVNRSKAIFGSLRPQSQPAYAGEIAGSSGDLRSLILSAERLIQNAFLRMAKRSDALFTVRGKPLAMILQSTGQRPPFLPKKLGHNQPLQQSRRKRRPAERRR